MATANELRRAAKHMRERSTDLSAARDAISAYGCEVAANCLTNEAQRLQAIEAQQPKRSWPEGWPPFAVLRMAHINTGAVCRPSAKLMDRVSPGAARVFRKAWKRELKRFSEPSSP